MTQSRQDSPRLLSLTVHEFRTPVTVVAGYLRMLLKDRAGPLTDAQRKLIEEAERSCRRLSDLLAELSEVAQIEGGKVALVKQPIELFPLLDEAAAAATAPARLPPDREVGLEWRGEAGPAPVSGDPVRLREALGAIVAAIIRDAVQSTVLVIDRSVRSEKSGRSARIIIGDPQTAEVLGAAGPGSLERFDDLRGGVGLRLTLARRIVEAHGARLFSPAGDRRKTGALILLPLAP